jgi:D-3-phosphoglycerate dehydrogenase
MPVKVLVCDPIETAGIQILRKAGFEVDEKPTVSREELLNMVDQYDALLVRGRTKVTKEVIQAGRRLKAIVRAGVGLDNIDTEFAKENGIQVLSTPAASTVSVAELTICLMLNVLRQVSLADRSMKEGKWIKPMLLGRELRGKTVGVVGAGGRIGGEVARILKEGFGANVVAYDVIDIRARAAELGMQLAKDLDDLVANCDIVTIHVPYSKATHHIFDAKRIAKMKKGSILINTSRGDIVDGQALLEAIKQRRISGAGLDVFHDEPPKEEWEKELVSLPDGVTVCTCHIGAQTLESQNTASVMAAETLVKIMKP